MNVDAIDRDVKRFRSESVRRGAPASLEGLAPVPHDVLARKLGTNAVRVLCLLVELSSAEGIAWPSKSWLAGRLDMGKGSLDRALARLKLFLLVIPKRRVFVPSEKKSVYGWEMLVTFDTFVAWVPDKCGELLFSAQDANTHGGARKGAGRKAKAVAQQKTEGKTTRKVRIENGFQA